LEQLYFASLKVHSSATNIRARDRAAQDFGTTAGEAEQSLQGLARFIRNNPAGEGVLESYFGVKVRDEHGKQRDMADVLLDIGKAMQTLPQFKDQPFRQQQFGQAVGLSEDTIRAISNPEFYANFSAILEQLRKGDFDKATQEAHAFMVQLRELGDQLTIFGLQVYEAIEQKFHVSLKKVTGFLVAHGPEMAKNVADVISKILDWSNKLLDFAIKLYDYFKKLDQETDGWSTKLAILLVVLGRLGAVEIIGGVLGLAGAFVKLGAAIVGASAGGPALVGLLGRLGVPIAAGVGGGYLLDKYFPNNWLARLGRAGSNFFYDQFHQRDNVTQRLTNLGFSRPQADAMTNVLNVESSLDPYATGDNGQAYGIGQWHKDRQALFKQYAGHDIQQSTGDRDKDIQEQLGFIRYEIDNDPHLKESMMHVAQFEPAFRNWFTSMYERPANPNQEIVRASPNINLSTDINVHGAMQDPAILARFIALENFEMNSRMVREFAPKLQ
jgi:hypothetical protein